MFKWLSISCETFMYPTDHTQWHHFRWTLLSSTLKIFSYIVFDNVYEHADADLKLNLWFPYTVSANIVSSFIVQFYK